MSDAAKVISVALGEVGYQEKATNAQLDDPGTNAGSGNWTKYARDLAAAGYYNGDKNGFEWCDVFVDWCFYKAFGKTEGELAQYQSGPLGAAVPYSAGYYKAKGRYDGTPRVGDQAFFQENGALVHTGIVTEVTPTTITTVEGNKGNRVSKQTYRRTDSYIAGYGHPDYDGSGGATPPVPETDPVKEWQTWLGVTADGAYGAATRTAAIAKALLGYAARYSLTIGSRGDMVKAVQGCLYTLDCDPMGLDGVYGPDTAAAVRAYQSRTPGLTADGVAGEATFAALFDL